MSNIIEFPSKSVKNQTKDWTFGTNYQLTDFKITFDNLELDPEKILENEQFWKDLFDSFPPENPQLDQLADACFDLQMLCEKHPETLQFVIKSVKKITENMKKRLTQS